MHYGKCECCGREKPLARRTCGICLGIQITLIVLAVVGFMAYMMRSCWG